MESRFPRSIESLDEVFGFAETFFAQNDVDDASRYAIGVAIEEIFTNMVKYNPSGGGDLTVQLDRQDDRALIGLTDSDSDEYDVTRIADANVNAPLDERTPGGLGIHLVRRLMDGMEYSWCDRKSTITMVKNLKNEPS